MLKICMLCALCCPAYAQVYKWVDEKGVTHYGERPPTGRGAREVRERLANPAPAQKQASEPNWKEKELEFRGRRIEARDAEAKKNRLEIKERQNCGEARDHLAQLKSARRLYRLDEKGERVYQSDAEREAVIARVQRDIAERCR